MPAPDFLKHRLAELPIDPGVYVYKDSKDKIIYIGKASILKRRVRSYFTKKHADVKTNILVSHIHKIDWIVTNSEIEALFLEAELIKRYKPIYNVDLKDDKNFSYVRITTNQDFPTIDIVRRPADDKARYFGPFISTPAVRESLRYLRRIFPYFSNSRLIAKSALEYQIGVAPHPDISKTDYRKNIYRLIMVLEGKSQVLIRQLERDMKKYSDSKQYESAAQLRDTYLALKGLSRKVIFGSQESFDIAMDQALTGLADRIGLQTLPKRLECYDISNFQGGDAVSSMVVFTNGTPHQSEYRKFKMTTKGPNDFGMMAETMQRRFSGRHDDWAKPDLIIIDGGKGQLAAATKVLDELKLKIPVVGLAKRHEEIVQRLSDAPTQPIGYRIEEHIDGDFRIISLPQSSKVIQLLQRIRDEAHRFAVSYHTTMRDKRTKTSLLDTIPGIGPATRKKLVRSFGSVVGVKAATESELAEVVGPAKAKNIKQHI